MSAEIPDLRRVLYNGQIPADDDFNSIHPGGWETWLTPHLRTLLQTNSGFSAKQIEDHCQFFNQYIVPWLGSSPRKAKDSHRLETTGPLSRLTKDGTPLEFSLVWKDRSDSEYPTVRYVADIAAQDSGSIRYNSLVGALSAFDKFDLLSASNEGLDILTFPNIWRAVTKHMMEFDKSQHGTVSCSRCGTSGVYFGFELHSTKIMLKPYWLLPTCASNAALLTLIDQIIYSCMVFDSFYRSAQFLANWSSIRQQILSEDSMSYMHPCMLSIDATRAPAQRFKLYTRCVFKQSPEFQAWGRQLHSSEAIDQNICYTNMLNKIWEDLRAPEEKWSLKERQVQPNFVWIQFELQPEAAARNKMVIMCPEIPRPDNYIARILREHCELLKDVEFVRSLSSIVEPSEFVTVVAIKAGRPVSEVAVYFSPAIFSRHQWKDRYKSNGHFTKVRNSLYTSGTK